MTSSSSFGDTHFLLISSKESVLLLVFKAAVSEVSPSQWWLVPCIYTQGSTAQPQNSRQTKPSFWFVTLLHFVMSKFVTDYFNVVVGWLTSYHLRPSPWRGRKDELKEHNVSSELARIL